MTFLLALKPLLPEISVCLSALVILMIGVFRNDDEKNGILCSWIAITAMLCLVTFFFFTHAEQAISDNTLLQKFFVFDSFSRLSFSP